MPINRKLSAADDADMKHTDFYTEVALCSASLWRGANRFNTPVLIPPSEDDGKKYRMDSQNWQQNRVQYSCGPFY